MHYIQVATCGQRQSERVMMSRVKTMPTTTRNAMYYVCYMYVSMDYQHHHRKQPLSYSRK